MTDHALFDAIANQAPLPTVAPELLDRVKPTGAWAGLTPLGLALLLGHHDAAQRLVDAGARLDAVDGDGLTVLLVLAGRHEAAATRGLEWLLQRSALALPMSLRLR